MIYYSGSGSEDHITLSIIGDGQQTQVIIDLSKSPFDHSYQGNFPAKVYAYNIDQDDQAPTVSISGSVLTLDFPEALPPPSVGRPSPRCQLEIYLFYPVPSVR